MGRDASRDESCGVKTDGIGQRCTTNEVDAPMKHDQSTVANEAVDLTDSAAARYELRSSYEAGL